ncbi:MAG: 16S rRNA (cytidine(1402)-2'-O)-methyltransferase [Candidatus Handelsmanbacteria bacterium RIFCSPLOWO2_12_FULL_64_10]|uniref:Ribosomal RNA small subunit methyltransferase I n=1 Tax=Handelsmanbacteria sp. (strain RIFCSPLOWO2_12_FULL_64_10) TaxID=1817868 RepID=A0A1F6CBH7_HANXR|nr:MAG: 16S rRNA (cytidine(1402)-2'-O)-methyltransferase [Candidatus Handelsmanbacteria bacterium RIFCSPLOWO2_12_FULL_64_10]
MSTLYVIATPIGNLEDMTFRAVRALGEVDALACEDTRTTRAIFERYQIPRPKTIFSYHEYNEESAGQRILGLLRGGASVALCTDGGYPGVSDPGYRIVSASVEAGFRVEVLPGAGAVATALVASGLPTSSYTFKGFPPRKPGPRRRFLGMEREAPHTLVLFESPYRVGRFLADACEVLGNRRAAVCVELTKKFEEVRRGFLRDLEEQFREAKIRGEVTIVIAGNSPKFAKQEDSPLPSPSPGEKPLCPLPPPTGGGGRGDGGGGGP